MSEIDAVTVRACGPGDANALALVGQATFLETFAGIIDGADIVEHCARQHAPAIYQDWLAQPDAAAWLAEANPGRAPVGYVVLAPARLPIADPRDSDLEIKRIYLLERFRGGGVGKRLLAEAIARAKARSCKRVLLGVYAENSSAIAFYERNGFRAAGHRQFTVGRHEYHDLILSLDF